MPAHKHADLILQYAQDAMETETPWDRWEVKINEYWEGFDKSPCWNIKMEYRRKPKVIIINGIEVPEPMRVAPPVGTPYFCISSIDTDIAIPTKWMDTDGDRRVLSRGICHLTEAAAVKHADALLSFTKVQD